MATEIIQPQMFRPASAKWNRPQSSMVVRPVSQQSVDLDLTITGTPTPGLDLDSSRATQLKSWQEHGHNSGKKKPRVAWATDRELFSKIKDKLTTGREGVRQMFQAMDPYGDSIVTREGLFFIVKSLVGHITRDQYDSLLKLICLHWRSSISFDEFVSHFNQELKQKNQFEHNQFYQDNQNNYTFTRAPHALVVLRRKLQEREASIRDLFPAASFVMNGRVTRSDLQQALSIIGLNLVDKEFEYLWLNFDPDNSGSFPLERLHKVLNLPGSGALNLDPRNIRSACSLQKNSVTNKEVLDKRCHTAISFQPGHMTMKNVNEQTSSLSRIESLEKLEGRDDVIKEGQEITFFDTPVTQRAECTDQGNVTVTTTKTTTSKSTSTTTTTTTTTVEQRTNQVVDDPKLSAHVRHLIGAKKSPPHFEDVVDHLHYKFEETYRNLHSAFRLFDFMNDGYVARIDFRRVLKEFGFEITALDLDPFLTKAGVSVIKGLINYRQFLLKFQTRRSSSILSQIIRRKTDSCERHQGYQHSDDLAKPEEMVEDLSRLFHSDYLKLVRMLKQKDKNSSGFVTANELRKIVNTVLKSNMSDRQFEKLMQLINEKSKTDGYRINYAAFLELFDSQPGMWNKPRNTLLVGPKYQISDIKPASPVLRLLEKSKTWMAPTTNKETKIKRLNEVMSELTKLFTDRFHVFDKNFQEMDRKRSGYMTKWQLGALLKLCGITLTISDLDTLWSSLDIAADNTVSYAVLVKAICPSQQAQRPATTSLRGKPASSEKLTQQPEHRGKSAPLAQNQGGARERQLMDLLRKIGPEIISRWDVVSSIFVNLDRDGYSSISLQDVKNILSKLRLPLSAFETDFLCNSFDLHGNGWFHYFNFLNAIKKVFPGQEVNPCVFNIHTKRLHKKAGPTSMAVTLYDFLLELKAILLKKFKTLRGSFKFFDHNHDGVIDESELRRSLTQLGYNLSSQDFLDILQLFDHSYNQKITFDDFKYTLLTV